MKLIHLNEYTRLLKEGNQVIIQQLNSDRKDYISVYLTEKEIFEISETINKKAFDTNLIKKFFHITPENMGKVRDEIRRFIKSAGIENIILKAEDKQVSGKSIFLKKEQENMGLFNDGYYVTLYLKKEPMNTRGGREIGRIHGIPYLDLEIKLNTKSATIKVVSEFSFIRF